MTDRDPGTIARLRKLRTLAAHLGMSRADRLEFASAFLERDIESWEALDDPAVCRLLDALEGGVLLHAWLLNRV